MSTRELEHHVLAPNEPDLDMEHIVVLARGEKASKIVPGLQSARSKEFLVASVARWEEHLRMLIYLERTC